MISLVAGEALSEQVVCMNASARAGDLARRPNRGVICAVFDEVADGNGEPGTAEDFLGLVPATLITRSPQKSFRELLPEDAPEPVAATASLPEVLKRMRIGQTDALGVLDENSRFLGVITHASIIAALLRREQELLKKSREYRNSVQEDKRRRYETVRRLEQMNHAFRKVLGLVARPPGKELFQRGVEALALAVRAGYAAVHLPEGASADRESIATGTPPGSPGETGLFFEQRWPLIEEVLRENHILLVNDAAAWMRRLGRGVRRPPFQNFLGVPISRENQVFGCLYFCDKLGEPFTDDDEVLVSSFAHSLALVLAQVRESAHRKRAERERDLLSRLGLELSGADTLEQVAGIVRKMTEEQWSWDSFSISVRRSGKTQFRELLEVDHTPAGEMEPLPAHDPDSLYETAPPPTRIATRKEFNARLTAGEALLLNRTAEYQGPDLEFFGCERPSISMVFAPVRVRDEVHGILTIQSYRPHFFQEADRVLLQKLADTVGPAIKRCQAERVGRAFSSLGLRLSTATEPVEAARTIIATADELLGWDACSVYLYDAEKRESENLIHMDLVNGQRQLVDPFRLFGPPSSMALQTIEHGPQIILREQPAFESGAAPFGDMSRPSLSLLLVPLRISERIIGLLSIQSYTYSAYDERDLALLQDLADHCSGALERTRLQRLERGSVNGQ